MYADVAYDVVVSTQSNFCVAQLIYTKSTVIGVDSGGVLRPATKVLAVTKRKQAKHVLIETKHEELRCSLDQKLFTDAGWLSAKKIKQGSLVYSAVYGWIPVERSTIIEKPLLLYQLALGPPHTFCIGKQQIVAHNAFVSIPLFTYFFGQGAVWFGGSVAAIAACFGKYLFQLLIEKIVRGKCRHCIEQKFENEIDPRSKKHSLKPIEKHESPDKKSPNNNSVSKLIVTNEARKKIKDAEIVIQEAQKPLVPLGQGSTGRSEPQNLCEQIAKKAVLSAPKQGKTLNLAKGMTDPRWPQEEGWVKMSQHFEEYGKDEPIMIHYVYNFLKNTIDDLKFKK